MPIADNEAGWTEALAKLAAFVEADYNTCDRSSRAPGSLG